MKIRNLRHKRLRRLIEDDSAAALQPAVVPKLRRILSFLQDMERTDDLRTVPGWKAHRLAGDRKEGWSLTVTRNWRIAFRIDRAEDEIVDLHHGDYHQEARMSTVQGIGMKKPAHPGGFVKSEIVEALGLTVTGAARALAVTRPALSALRNERASLLPEMALRIVRVFGVSMDTRMRMQTSHDIARTRSREDDIDLVPFEKPAACARYVLPGDAAIGR